MSARAATALVALLAVGGCATLQQFAALRSVDFSLEGVEGVMLAGIELEGVRSYQDLGLRDVGRLALAVRRRDLPLAFRVRVVARNPAGNPAARLMRMDWTLLLEDREAVTGSVVDEVSLPSGQPSLIPIQVSLNLVDFFEGSAQDMMELALSLTGNGGGAKRISLRASPTISTPLGPIRYPQPITLVDARVGGER